PPEYDSAISRHTVPEVLKSIAHIRRGRRECRVLAASAVSRAWVVGNAHTSIQVQTGATRHSLRNGFTAYATLSPATNSSCHRRWRIKICLSPVGPTHLRAT